VSSRLARIAQAATLVMAAYVVSRVLGLAREMIVARQFGTSAELGAYLAAFRVPDLIFQLLAGGALGSSLIPVLSEYLAHGQHREGWRLASAIYNLVGFLTTGFALLAFAGARPLAQVLVPGYSPELQALTSQLMRLMLVTPIIFGLSGVSMAVLNAHQHFLLPAIAPILYNLAIIAGAVWLAPQMGVHGLAIGVVVGSGLHLLVQLPGLLRRGWRWFPTWGRHLPGVRQVIRLLLPRVLGLAVVQINFIVSTRLASRLEPGSLPALNYAFLLMMLPQGVFAMALATAAFPAFSDLVARQQIPELRHTLMVMLRATLFLALPAAAGLYILRNPVIAVLLEGGRFTDASTKAVAWALQFYVLGLPAYAIVEILSRAFYALHDTRTPVLVGAATVALNIALSLALLGSMGIGGLALANAVAVNVEMVWLLWFMHKWLDGLEGDRLLSATLRVVGATAAMAVALYSVMRVMGGGYPGWLVAAAGVIIGGGVFVASAWICQVSEVRAVGNWLAGRLLSRRQRPGSAAQR